MTIRHGNSRAQRLGFTLLELMIVLAVLTILASIAYPSYKNFVVRTSREAAESQLQALANLQEKIFLNSGKYSTSVTGAYTGQSTGGLGSTGRTVDTYYTIAFATGASDTVFKLVAHPDTGPPIGDGDITIEQNGKREWTPSSGPVKSW